MAHNIPPNMTALANLTDSSSNDTVRVNANGVFIRPDGQWAYNMSTNSTVPWNNKEVLNNLIAQWIRLENLPGWWDIFKLIAILSMLILTLVVRLSLRYPLWEVFGTMTIVEAPQTLLQATSAESEKKTDDVAYITTNSRTRATTSSLRTSIRHVYRISGFTSFYRGTANLLCIGIGKFPFFLLFVTIAKKMMSIIGMSDDSQTKHEIAGIAASLLASVVTVTWETAYTHVLITQPTLRVWYRRLPPYWKTLKLVWPCIAAEILASRLTFDVPEYVMSYVGVYKKAAYLGPNVTGNALLFRRLTFTAIWLMAQAARLGLLVPVQIAKVRVQTSMLPDEEETIVPVDRAFGTAETENRNCYVPRGILATSSEPIGLRKAWTTYNRGEMKRILLMYGKFMLIELVMLCAFWPILGNNVWPNFWNPKGSF